MVDIFVTMSISDIKVRIWDFIGKLTQISVQYSFPSS